MEEKKLGWVKNLKDKENPNDKKMTPIPLAKKCISFMPFNQDDIVLDPFRGTGHFYNNYPKMVNKEWCEIEEDRDFFNYKQQVDWICSNPPYSKIQAVIEHSCDICNKGFGLLIGIMNLTPRRIHYIKKKGYNITHIHIVNVSGWFSNSVFFLCEKEKQQKITYDELPYDMPYIEMLEYKKQQKLYQENYYKGKRMGKKKELIEEEKN